MAIAGCAPACKSAGKSKRPTQARGRLLGLGLSVKRSPSGAPARRATEQRCRVRALHASSVRPGIESVDRSSACCLLDLDQGGNSGIERNYQLPRAGDPAVATKTNTREPAVVAVRYLGDGMSTFLYRCPNTGLRVQGWIANEPTERDEDSFESVTCPACGRVHLVNPQSGKVLGGTDNGLARQSLGIVRVAVRNYLDCAEPPLCYRVRPTRLLDLAAETLAKSRGIPAQRRRVHAARCASGGPWRPQAAARACAEVAPSGGVESAPGIARRGHGCRSIRSVLIKSLRN
jgi:hypothetical protein